MLSGSARPLAVVLALLACASVLAAPGRVSADPFVSDNADGTSTVVWNFTNPADYALASAAISGGVASLAPQTTWWNSTSAADFAGPDSETNIERAQWPGAVTLATTSGPMTLFPLQPGATGEDTWLDRNNANTNHGADTTMVLDGRNPQSRPILRFDLSSVPAGAAIDDAVLNLYEASGVGASFTASVYHVTSVWSEMQATWNDRLTGTAWNAAGGDWDPHVIAQITVDNTVGWKSWNVTQLVDLWYRGRLTNNGMILNAPSTGADADKTFYTSDYNVDPTRRPRLDIRYRVLGSSGTYVSRVGGPGTQALWQTISWNGTGRSLVSDEFSGPSLDPKWTWTNPPPAFDVGTTTPGHLHAVSSTGVDLLGGAFTGNVLADGVVGDFTATMKFTANPTVNGQKAGLMALLGPRDWYGVQKQYIGATTSVNWRVRSTADAVTTTWVDVNSGNPNPSWVRIQRVGNTFTAYTSTDGSTWTLRNTHAPAFEFPLGIRIAFFTADGASGTALSTDMDYLRVTFGNDATVAVSTRTGDTTPVDGTWSVWSAPYPAASGSAMAGNSRYIEYRLALGVTYPDHVPLVGDVNVSWFRYAATGSIETNDLVPGDLAAWGTATTVHALNGQSVTYDYSLDGGGSWIPFAPPADLSGASVATGRIRFRASLSTANTIVTPTVSEIRFTYTHRLDHFHVTASAGAGAGAPFSVTVTAKDALNATITSWTGSVALAARLVDGITPGGGVIGTTSLTISAGGTATIATETYTKAETIRVRASAGAAAGLSGPILISPGPVSRVTLTPSNATLTPFDTQVFVATAFDALDNPVPGVSFNWTVVGAVGSLNATTGPSVLFTASPPPANGSLEAAFGAIQATAPISVVSGIPPWVAIASPGPGGHVTGVVPIAYTTSADAISLQFDYDGGAGWTLIGTTGVLNGTYFWDTGALNFVGGGLRAIVTNNKTIMNSTIVSPIEVDNAPPSITLGTITDDQAGAGTISIAYATDPDVVRVDFGYFDGAWTGIGSDFSVDGAFVWTPGVRINGVTLRAVSVDDVNLTGADQKQGVGTYVVGSSPPAIAAIPEVHVRTGLGYALNLTFYVSDPDTPLASLAITDSDPANVTANAGTYPSLLITYASAGTYLVTLWVSDGTDTAWRIVRVIASNAQSPPALVAALPLPTFDEDTLATDVLGGPATLYFSDPDGDPLVFTVLDGVRILAIVNGNDTIDLWALPNWFGGETVRVRATEPSGGFAEAALRVDVRPVNDDPILLAPLPAVAFDEDVVSLDAFGGNVSLRFSDVDGDLLSITVVGAIQIGTRVNGDGTIDLWAPANWSGSEPLRVRATDPSGVFIEGPFLVNVRPVNDAPVVVSALPPVTFDEDSVALDGFAGPAAVHFLDRDGDLLAITVGAGSILARVNGNGTVDLWAPANWFGAESVQVRATDPSGAWVELPVLVTVLAVNDAPTLSPIALIQMTEGETRVLNLAPYVSDVDTPLSNLVVSTSSAYVRANGLVLTMTFPGNWTQARFTVSVSDGSAAGSQELRVMIVPPVWKVVAMPAVPLFIAMVIGVFVQRQRWRPVKAFLVDERKQMLREFTLDPSCEVTFDQVREAGALDAVEKAVKVSRYHAQTVRGDALAVTLLAYGPVTAGQIEFAREMLVNIQGTFEDHVKARLDEARTSEARLAADRDALAKGQMGLDVRSRAFADVFDSMTVAQTKVAAEAAWVRSQVLDMEHREALLRQEKASLADAKAALATERQEFDTLAGRLQDEMHRRKGELDTVETRLHDRQVQLKQDVETFETTRTERTQWIASKDLELEARQHTLGEKEAAIRGQGEENARVLADLAAREEAYEIEGDRLEKVRAEVESTKRELEATAAGLQAKAAELRDLESRNADEFRVWQSTMESQQALLREEREAFEKERLEARDALTARQAGMGEREDQLADREAKARTSVEWAMRVEDEAKARQASAAETLASAEALRAQVDAVRESLSRQSADLETREQTLKEDVDRRSSELDAKSRSLRESEAVFAERKDREEKELSGRTARIAAMESDLEAKIDSFERRALGLLEREEEAASLKDTLEREKADGDALARRLAARDVELTQVAQRNEEEGNRLRSETEGLHQSVASREAELLAERERLERESRSLQDTLGAKAADLAGREKVLAARETEIAAKIQGAEARARELEGREREVAVHADEVRTLAATVTDRQATIEARAAQLEESSRKFAAEQDAKRAEWESLQQVLKTQEARSKTEVESRLGQIAAKAVELEKREREMTSAMASLEEQGSRLGEKQRALEARDAESAETWTRVEQRMAELRALETEITQSREAFEAERGAWAPRFKEEMKQLEATRDATAEQQQKAERLGEEAQRRATVADDAERASKRKLEELSMRQAQVASRLAEVEKSERAVEAHAAELQEASQRLGGKEMELAGIAKDLDARGARLEARAKEVTAASEDLAARKAALDQEAARLAKQATELDAARRSAEAGLTEAETRLFDVVEREKVAKKREADVASQERALSSLEVEVAKREAAISEQEGSFRGRLAEYERMRLEIEGMTAKADEDRRAAATAKEEATAAREKAEKMKAQVDAQQAEVSKHMKFLQKKAVETLDREDVIRKREGQLAEREGILESKFEIVENKEQTMELEREEFTRKLSRAQLEIDRLQARLSAAETGSTASADLEDRNKDIENRLKIIQRKAMELLDREEKVRQREEELKDQAQKRGVQP